MASNLKFSTALRNAMGDAITTTLGGSAVLEGYDGTQPAGPGTAVTTQTKLFALTCNATFAGSTTNGVLTLNSITQDSSADATGTCTWWRLKTSGGTAHIDGSAGTSGADLNLSSVSIVTGGTVSISSATITIGNG